MPAKIRSYLVRCKAVVRFTVASTALVFSFLAAAENALMPVPLCQLEYATPILNSMRPAMVMPSKEDHT